MTSAESVKLWSKDMIKRLVIFLIAVLIISGYGLYAQSTGAPQEAGQLVKTTVSDALKIIDSPTISTANKREKLKALIMPFFDFKTITMLTVGKEYWSKLSPDEAASLTSAYERYLLKFYLDKVVQLSAGKVTYGTPISVGSKVHVPVTMTDKGQQYQMMYKFYYKNGWKAYDFELEGVSIIQTYHSQFEPFLKKGDINGLIRVLK